jgi:hypothetical protein
MSTIKSPSEKKLLSLKLDRRNTYGENAKASRKLIQSGKQRQHMNERRSAAEVLRGLKGSVAEDEASNAELLVKTRVLGSRRGGFKKQPDTPLGVILATKKAGRPKRAAAHVIA